MLKSTILAIAIMGVGAFPAFAQSSGSEAMAGATNSLTLEGSVNGSVGVGNNTAPCQQVNGLSVLGAGVSNSRTLEWCLSTEMAKTVVQLSRMKGEERRVTAFTLCSVSREYRRILADLGYCTVVTRGSQTNTRDR